MDWDEIIGCAPGDFCDRLYESGPDWVEGQISRSDARFLFSAVLACRPKTIVEVGTASGFSTAFLAAALDFVSRGNAAAGDCELFSYDISRNFYADERHPTGDAIEEMVAPVGCEVILRHPATARDLLPDHGADAIDFEFIDANHSHPWPALDLMASLDVLRPGAVVAMHDINLPEVNSAFPVFGAKWLFEELEVDKRVDTDAALPNIGSLTIPEDEEGLRDQIRDVIAGHPWEIEVHREIVDAVLGERSSSTPTGSRQL